MLLFIRSHATPEEIQQMAEDFGGYLKVVVDVQRNILVGGGKRHVDAEQMLLSDGSKQEDLWGGGWDSDTKEIDYNSMINLRPSQENPSRDILSVIVRDQFVRIIRSLFE